MAERIDDLANPLLSREGRYKGGGEPADIASLTARVEAQAARIEELEGGIKNADDHLSLVLERRAGDYEGALTGRPTEVYERGAAKGVRIARKALSRALQARGEDDGE